MTPEVVPHYFLVMSYGPISQADAERAWSLQEQVNDLLPSFVIVYFDCDKQLDLLVVLDLLDRLFLGFFSGCHLGPSFVYMVAGETRG